MTVPGGLVSLFVGGAKVQTDTGWVFPSAGVNGTGIGNAWGGTTNIYTDNNTDANVYLFSSDSSKMLRGYTFGLSIPTSATILGIEARGEMWSSQATGLRLDRIYVTPGSTLTGTDGVGAQNLGAVRAVRTFGSSTDLWGQTWTASDINGSGFSVQVGCLANSTKEGSCYCDYLQVKVYYEY